MRVLVVGEGPHEEGALPMLVRRLQPAATETPFDFVKNGRRVHGKGRGMFKKAVGWMLDAHLRQCDALVFLTDEDGDRSRRSQMEEAQAWMGTRLPRACGVAIRNFDAWFLADETALTAVLGVHIDRQPDPEQMPDPKRHGQTLLGKSEAMESLGHLYEQVSKQVELATLSQRCKDGFAPFAERVRRLG